MIIREIFDHNGASLGSISFADGTSPEVIAAKVAEYAVAPEAPNPLEEISSKKIIRNVKAAGLFMKRLQESGADVATMLTVASTFGPAYLLLLSDMVDAAKAYAASVTPSGLLTQDHIDQFAECLDLI
jgi:hypothetical protein